MSFLQLQPAMLGHSGLANTKPVSSLSVVPRITETLVNPYTDNTKAGTLLFNMTVANEASGQTYSTWQIESDHLNAFAINPATGIVTAGTDLRQAGSPTLQFVVTVVESPSGNTLRKKVYAEQVIIEPLFPDPNHLASTLRLTKLRSDYYEFSVLAPISTDGIDWVRHLFTNRLNTGNAGAPRLVRSSLANIFVQAPVTIVTNNLSTDVHELTATSTLTTSAATARVGTWTGAVTQSGLVTDSRYTDTVGDYVEYTLTASTRAYLRCYINTAVGGIASVTVKENDVDVPASSLLPYGGLVVQNERTGISWIPLAKSLDVAKTYVIRLTLDASSGVNDRLFDGGIIGTADVAYNAVGRHGGVVDQSIGSPLISYRRSLHTGTTLVYECPDCSRISYEYFQIPSSSFFRLTVYDASGALVATKEVDGYGSSTHTTVVAATGLVKGTHYLHIESMPERNASSTGSSVYHGAPVAVDEHTAGTFGVDAFNTNGVSDFTSQPAPYTIQGTGNIEYSVRANKPANAVGVAVDTLGGSEGHETTPAILNVAVDGADVTAAYLAAAPGTVWDAAEFVITYESELTFADGGDCAQINGVVTINREGVSFDHTRTLVANARIFTEYAMMLQGPEGSGTEGGYAGGFQVITSPHTGDRIVASRADGTTVFTKRLSNKAILQNQGMSVSMELLNAEECDASVSAFTKQTATSFVQDPTFKQTKFYRNVGNYGANGVVFPTGSATHYHRMMRIASVRDSKQDFTHVVLQAVTELTEADIPVAQLSAPYSYNPTYSIVNGTGAFKIADVPLNWAMANNQPAYVNGYLTFVGEETVKGLVVDDPECINFRGGPIRVEIAATGLPNKIITIPVTAFAWALELDFADSNVTDHPSLTFMGGTNSTSFPDYEGTASTVIAPSRIGIVGGRALSDNTWESTSPNGVPLPDDLVQGALLDGTSSAQRFRLTPDSWYDPAGGTFLMEVQQAVAGTERIFEAYSASGSGVDNMFVFTSGSNRRLYVKTGSTTQVSMAGGAEIIGQRDRIVIRLKKDACSITSNGVTTKDTDAELFVPVMFRLGLVAGTTHGLTLRRLVYTPRVLTDAQVDKLSQKSLGAIVHKEPIREQPFTTVTIPRFTNYKSLFGVRKDKGNEIPSSFAQEILVTTKTEFDTAADNILPGGCIRIQDGTYNDWGLVYWDAPSVHGTADNRIYVLPETAGGVTFTGDMYLRIRRDYVTVRGFTFDGCSGLTHTVRFEGDHGQFIRNTINASTSYGIGLYADDCEIADNMATNCDGAVFAQPDTNPDLPHIRVGTKRNWYHHNTIIRPGAYPGGNAGSWLALGYGFSPLNGVDDHAGAIAEWNYIDTRSDGEMITVKSSSNIIRYNWFEAGDVTNLSVRMGSDNLIYGNIFTGQTIGWRALGERNVFAYNFVVCSGGVSHAMQIAGRYPGVDPTKDAYIASIDNVQHHNIFVEFEHHTGVQNTWDDTKYPRPRNNNTHDNLFLAQEDAPSFEGYDAYTETVFNATSHVTNNHTLIVYKDGGYLASDPITIDFGLSFQYHNDVHGLVVIDPKNIPWMEATSYQTDYPF